MKKDNGNTAALALLGVIILCYFALGYSSLKLIDRTLDQTNYRHFKTLEDILNGNN